MLSLVVASGNPHKVAEIGAMLALVELEVLPLPPGLEVEETGATYLANARLKAEAVARITGHWALADDSGIEVDALGGAPGIFSARYAPTDHERIHRLLKELGDGLYRGASFRSAMALADPSGTIRAEAEGICRGQILRAPPGQWPWLRQPFLCAGSRMLLRPDEPPPQGQTRQPRQSSSRARPRIAPIAGVEKLRLSRQRRLLVQLALLLM